jgi:hypothetical protein
MENQRLYINVKFGIEMHREMLDLLYPNLIMHLYSEVHDELYRELYGEFLNDIIVIEY